MDRYLTGLFMTDASQGVLFDDFLFRLLVSFLVGQLIGWAYRTAHLGLSYSQGFVQSIVLLAMVTCVVMTVVGDSLARAFGIVGAANLIRYRSKIDDPKDAVVMLCSLSVGLASGAGIFPLAIFATVFIVGALWVIESFEPQTVKRFALKIKLGADTDELRQRIEPILKRAKFQFERRITSDDEVAYDVTIPMEADTERVTDAIRQLDPKRQGTVEWEEKKSKTK